LLQRRYCVVVGTLSKNNPGTTRRVVFGRIIVVVSLWLGKLVRQNFAATSKVVAGIESILYNESTELDDGFFVETTVFSPTFRATQATAVARLSTA
jgi:hypothetical protein